MNDTGTAIAADPFLIDLDAFRADLAEGKVIKLPPLEIIRALSWRKQILFCTRDIPDPIMRQHRMGQFYETKDLLALKPFFPKGGVFVDIGANVGNHSLFAALHLKPSVIVPIEPNPLSYTVLLSNIVVNNFAHLFDLSAIGFGAADKAAGGYSMEARARNVGAAKMLPDSGDIEVRSGDELLAHVAPSLIKIDVEGMENLVLAGLRDTIKKHRPTILIEVDNANEAVFLAWLEKARYEVVRIFIRYKTNKNYLIKAA